MKRFAVLPLLAALAAAVPVLSGCGAEELAGVDVAEAADATTRKGTARMTLQFRVSGLGLPQTVDFDAEGVTALAEPKMNVTMDLGKLLDAAGVSGDGKVEMRLDGRNLYIKPPEVEGLNLPSDWVGLDLAEIVRAMGIDPDAASLIFRMDPAAQLRALSAADMETIGTEEIGGVETTHLKGTITTRDLLEGLPKARRADAEKALEQIEALSEGPSTLDNQSPTDLWVDGNSIVRRMQMSSKLPPQNGAPGGSFDMTYELSDFGAELDVSKPDDVADFTGKLSDLLKSQAGASAG